MTTPSEMSHANTSHPRASRRHGRELALQILFQREFQKPDTLCEEEFWSKQSVSAEVRAFTLSLVQGVLQYQADIDQVIATFAVGWSVERMPVVDRNILRCAIYELLREPDIPAMVTINEAIELAKRFADDEAKRFINGLLDHVLHDDLRLSQKRNHLKPQPLVSEISHPTPIS